jgi:hypothetical protein
MKLTTKDGINALMHNFMSTAVSTCIDAQGVSTVVARVSKPYMRKNTK